MSVYVDDERHRFGRMQMGHMMADSTEELLAMADRIGVARKWIQHAGEPKEHFDVCWSKRVLAVSFGAIRVNPRKFVELIRARRARPPGKGPRHAG